MNFKDIGKEIIAELDLEFNAIKNNNTNTIELTNGRYCGSVNDKYIYNFEAYFIHLIQPDTPIEIRLNSKNTVAGIWLSQEDFDVLIGLDEMAGVLINEAKIISDTSFILKKLQERIIEEIEQTNPNNNLGLGILNQIEMKSKKEYKHINAIKKKFSLAHKENLTPNEYQELAIANSNGSSLHYIWGPPGTGKTHALGLTALTLSASSEKILILSHSNLAVDIALNKTLDLLEKINEYKQGTVLRIGFPHLNELRQREELKIETQINKHSPGLLEKIKNLEKQYKKLNSLPDDDSSLNEIEEQLKKSYKEKINLETIAMNNAKIIGTTVSRLVIDDKIWHWHPDTIIIDEVSMVNFPFVFITSTRANKRLLLFGDFRQLPPVTLTNEPGLNWLNKDVFEISGIKDKIDRKLPAPNLTMLKMQYRMNSQIGTLVNTFAYNGELLTHESVDHNTHKIIQANPFQNQALIIADTGNFNTTCCLDNIKGSYSRINPLNGLIAASIAESVEPQFSVSVITPYHKQAKFMTAIAKLLVNSQHIKFATVHRFQGSESDIVIFDLSDAHPLAYASSLTGRDFDLALRLFNVAISRAKGKVIFLVDFQAIETYHNPRSQARKLLALFKQLGTNIRLNTQDLINHYSHNSIKWYQNWADLSLTLTKLITTCPDNIYLNIPSEFNNTNELINSLTNLVKTDHITIFAKNTLLNEVENTQADLRLAVKDIGFFAFFGNDIALIGTNNELSPIAYLNQTNVFKFLKQYFLGNMNNLSLITTIKNDENLLNL